MLKSETFHRFMNALEPDFGAEAALAVAVSGGPDSMALARLLSQWAVGQDKKPKIYVLCVDHGLRPEAADEAAQVVKITSGWPGVQAHVLRWDHAGVEARLMEEARAARYRLMGEYCRDQKINYLFLAHHQDDQAETVLFRLAKGSGLDGLAGMSTLQEMDEGPILVRPLLGVSKEDILAFCDTQGIAFVHDPSNDSEKFARVRLRGAREVLEAEGLTSSRLSGTAARLSRARQALDFYADKAYHAVIEKINTKQIVFKFDILKEQPEEVVLRVLQRAMHSLVPFEDYPPRLEKLEALARDLLREGAFRKRTLGGVIFARDDHGSYLILVPEHDQGSGRALGTK